MTCAMPCDGCGGETDVGLIHTDQRVWHGASDPWPMIGSPEEPISGDLGMFLCAACRHGVQLIVAEVVRRRMGEVA